MNQKKLSYDEFIIQLNEKSNGKLFYAKRWSNYPNSIFYYWREDINATKEIAIYTNENAWGIYI
jgi:hypothetical protein